MFHEGFKILSNNIMHKNSVNHNIYAHLINSNVKIKFRGCVELPLTIKFLYKRIGSTVIFFWWAEITIRYLLQYDLFVRWLIITISIKKEILHL